MRTSEIGGVSGYILNESYNRCISNLYSDENSRGSSEFGDETYHFISLLMDHQW